MTIGIGGQSTVQALAKLTNMRENIAPITAVEYQKRLNNVQQLMKNNNISALFITPGSNLIYFVGINLMCTERLTGVILTVTGQLTYIVPHFELDSFREHLILQGAIATWQEHQDPVGLVINEINNNLLINNNSSLGTPNRTKVAICGSTSFTTVNKFISGYPDINVVCADEITTTCRQIKSTAEIAIIKTVMAMTLAVQQAAASVLYEGISSEEVVDFIDKAHKKVGATGSYFCLVLFAQASALPHGIKGWQTLALNDMVLIDTGCKLMGYTSDITRSYVYGKPNEHQRRVWNAEKAAQAAAFSAAKLSNTCEYVDQKTRVSLAKSGFSEDYELRGLPHRTGHGIGIDIHESPYLVGGDKTRLAAGMCFSNEPTICVPGKFGIRLEDHFYMTKTGPKWFTSQSLSIEEPFGVGE